MKSKIKLVTDSGKECGDKTSLKRNPNYNCGNEVEIKYEDRYWCIPCFADYKKYKMLHV